MSENSIAQTDATQPERWWFTFGAGHIHPETGEELGRAYVVIDGTYDSARDAMFASAFGNRWSHQYHSADRAGVTEFGLHEVAMPTALPADECGCPVRYAAEIRGSVTPGAGAGDTLVEHVDDCRFEDDQAAAGEDPEFVDPWAVVEPTPAEPVDELVPEADPKRAAYIQGLREIAAFLDAHPEVELPHLDSNMTGKWEPTLQILLGSWTTNQREQLAAAGRAMGKFDKYARPDGNRFVIYRRFAGIALAATAERDEVCERIVVGMHEVTEEVPDPEAVAALPTVTVTKVVEDVRWECRSILADEPKSDAAEAAIGAGGGQ